MWVSAWPLCYQAEQHLKIYLSIKGGGIENDIEPRVIESPADLKQAKTTENAGAF